MTRPFVPKWVADLYKAKTEAERQAIVDRVNAWIAEENEERAQLRSLWEAGYGPAVED